MIIRRETHIKAWTVIAPKKRIMGDLIETFKIINGFECIDLKKFYPGAKTTHLRGHCGKLFKDRSKLLCRTVASTFLVNDEL